MVKHLRSSNRFEPDSAGGAFDNLPARGTTTQRSATGVFQFFRQNVDAGDLFLMTSPKHWAQCLTLHSFYMFRRFQPEEFFRSPFPAWQVKPESLRKQLVPNISANTDFFNLIKDFFVGCIFRNDATYRKRAIMHVIDIAYCMKQLNNFDGMFSAMSALDSVGVFRLKKIWQSISNPEYEAKLSELRFLMESRSKYANYTEALRKAFPPKLPYIGHFLGSLFMQSERHPKVSQSKLNIGWRSGTALAPFVMLTSCLADCPKKWSFAHQFWSILWPARCRLQRHPAASRRTIRLLRRGRHVICLNNASANRIWRRFKCAYISLCIPLPLTLSFRQFQRCGYWTACVCENSTSLASF